MGGSTGGSRILRVLVRTKEWQVMRCAIDPRVSGTLSRVLTNREHAAVTAYDADVSALFGFCVTLHVAIHM